ncbi:hypothetical protein MFIFM68171_10689 [Madurella fahalii]|uniref:Uncharacterized protein n=1 Tax=Madurella fahalii TaxID=1157608 RepID=A0ABQ0GRX8_9PEZI
MNELTGLVPSKGAVLALDRGMLLSLQRLLRLGLVAFGRGLQFGQPDGSGRAEGSRGQGGIGLRQPLLGLDLLPLEELIVIAEMRGHGAPFQASLVTVFLMNDRRTDLVKTLRSRKMCASSTTASSSGRSSKLTK